MNPLQELQRTDEYPSLVTMINQLDLNGEPQIGWVHRATNCIRDDGKRLGIFSGSFNPLTVAHVKMIEEAQAQSDLEEILLLLAKANVDKGVFGFSLADRLLMLKRYAIGRNDFSVAACSHGRYVEKMKALKMVYPPRTAYSFIVGYDTLVRIFDSRYYTDIHAELEPFFNQCRFIAANRKEHNVDAIEQFLAEPEHKRYASNVDVIELPDFYAEVSSTAIRDHILRGDSINHLVPETIGEYIKATKVHSQNGE